MKRENKKQIKGRKFIISTIFRVQNSILDLLNKMAGYPITILILKGMAFVYLIVIQPYASMKVVEANCDLELMSYNTIISVICALVLLISRKDCEDD